MNIHYYKIRALERRRGTSKLLWVVEISDFLKLSEFVVASKGKRVKTHADCVITLSQCYVSSEAELIFENFMADGNQELMKMALEAQKG